MTTANPQGSDHERLTAIAELRRTCLNTPWVHQGRLPGKALDCIGLVLELAKLAGVDPAAIGIPSDYGRFPHRGQLRRIVEAHMVKVPLAEAKVGDVALVAWGIHPMHLIVLANYLHDGVGPPFSALHAENMLTEKVGECRFDSPNWAVVGCYRFPKWA